MFDLTPDAADRCRHCGNIFRWPPDCCEQMKHEYAEQQRAEWEGWDDEDDLDYEE